MYQENPICHDNDWQAQRWAPTTWRPKGEKLHPSNDLPMVFRTCSYCGSIHPEDLMLALKAGAKLSGADWKYGWPHKFYVDQIPNTNAGALASYISGTVRKEERAELEQRYPGKEVRFEETEYGLRYKVYEADGPTTHGKWYNLHFMDLDGPEFDELSALVEAQTGVKFARDEQGVKYAVTRRSSD